MRIERDARRLATASCIVLSTLGPATVAAQGYPFSQRATLTQDIAFTTVKVEYGRPVARGRPLFGQLVPWDSVWHPGADSATRVTINRDVTVEGRELKAGEYSLWLIPREKGSWTVIWSRAAHVFHKPYPGAESDVLRVDVATETLSHMETLAIEFPVVLREDAVMRIHWGTVGVPMRIKASYRPPGSH